MILIEDFYYGNIEPQECTTNLTAKVKNSLSELVGKEEQLASLFSFKPKEKFTLIFSEKLLTLPLGNIVS